MLTNKSRAELKEPVLFGEVIISLCSYVSLQYYAYNWRIEWSFWSVFKLIVHADLLSLYLLE
jgi:hypothetical protein